MDWELFVVVNSYAIASSLPGLRITRLVDWVVAGNSMGLILDARGSTHFWVRWAGQLRLCCVEAAGLQQYQQPCGMEASV